MWEAAQADATMPIFIVTSKENDRIVREFFENNEHLLAKFGVDTAENGPLKVC